MTQCGVQGRRVMKLPAQDGTHDHLVHLVCTEDEHEGDQHYDGTYGIEFDLAHTRADA
jgi:hypothetical protein